MVRPRRISTRALIVALIALAVGSTAAYGYSLTYFNGFTAQYGGEYGPRHSITKNEVNRTGGYDRACINALNSDGSGWAGATYCTSSYTYHSYCGCKLRYPWVADAGQYENTNKVNYGVNVVAIEFY